MPPVIPTSIRLEAMRGLVVALAAVLPPGTPIVVSQTPPAPRAPFPSVAIVPSQWKSFFDQAGEHYVTSNTQVVNVGRHEAIVQIRIVAATPQQRSDLEQAIMNLFAGMTMAASMRPGILLTTISSIPVLHDFVAAWELESAEWQDEMAFSNQWYSVIEVTGIIPALVSIGSVYRIDDLRMAFTNDMTTPFTAADVQTSKPPKMEVVDIDQDGDLTRL